MEILGSGNDKSKVQFDTFQEKQLFSLRVGELGWMNARSDHPESEVQGQKPELCEIFYDMLQKLDMINGMLDKHLARIDEKLDSTSSFHSNGETNSQQTRVQDKCLGKCLSGDSLSKVEAYNIDLFEKSENQCKSKSEPHVKSKVNDSTDSNDGTHRSQVERSMHALRESKDRNLQESWKPSDVIHNSQEKKALSVKKFENLTEGLISDSLLQPPYKVAKKDLCLPVFYGYGKDVGDWIYKANEFFKLHQTPESEKVSTATFYLKEDAKAWWKDVQSKHTGEMRWVTFALAMRSRFGRQQGTRLGSKLSPPLQTGSVDCLHNKCLQQCSSRVNRISYHEINAFSTFSNISQSPPNRAEALEFRPSFLESEVAQQKHLLQLEQQQNKGDLKKVECSYGTALLISDGDAIEKEKIENFGKEFQGLNSKVQVPLASQSDEGSFHRVSDRSVCDNSSSFHGLNDEMKSIIKKELKSQGITKLSIEGAGHAQGDVVIQQQQSQFLKSVQPLHYHSSLENWDYQAASGSVHELNENAGKHLKLLDKLMDKSAVHDSVENHQDEIVGQHGGDRRVNFLKPAERNYDVFYS